MKIIHRLLNRSNPTICHATMQETFKALSSPSGSNRVAAAIMRGKTSVPGAHQSELIMYTVEFSVDPQFTKQGKVLSPLSIC